MTTPRVHRVGQHIHFIPPDEWVPGMGWTGELIDGKVIMLTKDAWASIDSIDQDAKEATVTIHTNVMVDNGTWGFQAVEPVQTILRLDWLELHTVVTQEPLEIEEPIRAADRAKREEPILFGGVEESTAQILRGLAAEEKAVDRSIMIDGIRYDIRIPDWMTDEQAALTIKGVLEVNPTAFGESVPDDQPDAKPDFVLEPGINPDKVD